MIRRHHWPCLCVFPGNGSESEEDHSAGASGSPALSVTHRAPDFPPGHTKMDVIKKGLTRDSQRYKVDYGTQSTVTQNFSSESQQDTEYVSAAPCSSGGWAWVPRRSPLIARGCSAPPALLPRRPGALPGELPGPALTAAGRSVWCVLPASALERTVTEPALFCSPGLSVPGSGASARALSLV